MEPEAGAAPQRRSWSRVPLRAKVRMEFADQRYFLSEWAVNLSPGGMFVRSESPMAAGQRFTFEASLTPKGPRFGGVAEVLWVRRESDRPTRPAGFAVQFLELEEAGRQAMIRLADVFHSAGLAAMEQELERLAAAWQEQRLNEEATEELSTDEEEPLQDTVVIPPPYGVGEDDTAQLEPEEAEPATPAATVVAGAPVTAPAAAQAPVVATPAAAEPAVQPAPAAATAPRAPGPEPRAAGRAPAPAAGTAATGEADAPAVTPPMPRQSQGSEAPERAPGGRGLWWVLLVVAIAGGAGYLAWRQGSGGEVLADRPEPPAGDPGLVVPAGVSAPVTVAGEPAGIAVPPFEALSSVDWSTSEDGLWVALELAGALTDADYRHERVAAAPPEPTREIFHLYGARRGYERPMVAVDLPELARIRFGYHPDPAGDELRVVFDLPSPEVGVRRVENHGTVLRILLGRQQDDAAAAASAAVQPPPSAAPAGAAGAAGPRRPE